MGNCRLPLGVLNNTFKKKEEERKNKGCCYGKNRVLEDHKLFVLVKYAFSVIYLSKIFIFAAHGRDDLQKAASR